MSQAQSMIPALQKSKAPFYFNTSEHLLRISREKASNIKELFDCLGRCPRESVFQHTFRTLQEHHFIRHGFSNDLAHWCMSACNEPALAEQLASVDVREFTDLEELRGALLRILDSYIHEHGEAAARPAEEPFYFCLADLVVVPTNFVPDTLRGFADGLRSVTIHSIHHHFIEARLRLKLMSNDFSQWLLEEMSLPDVAREINRIDIYTGTMENVRQQIVRIVERAMQ